MKSSSMFALGLVIGVSTCGIIAALHAETASVAGNATDAAVGRYLISTSPSGTFLVDSTNGETWTPNPSGTNGKPMWSWDRYANAVGK